MVAISVEELLQQHLAHRLTKNVSQQSLAASSVASFHLMTSSLQVVTLAMRPLDSRMKTTLEALEGGCSRKSLFQILHHKIRHSSDNNLIFFIFFFCSRRRSRSAVRLSKLSGSCRVLDVCSCCTRCCLSQCCVTSQKEGRKEEKKRKS